MDKKDIIQSLQTVADYIRWGSSQLANSNVFYGHGTENPWDEAAAIVYHVLSLPHDLNQPIDACRLTSVEKEAILELVERRIETRKPLPYLTGKAMFCGLEFLVDETVLIPRSPIGELIEEGFRPWLQEEPSRLLDLCTGSGCIAVAVALAFPESSVVASDISSEALRIAEKNVETYELSDDVELIQSDVFEGIEKQAFDLIVSNPPYVDAYDMSTLPEEFEHGPELALAAGEDGLDIVKRILSQAADYLSDDGVLMVEVGNSWEALEAAYPEVPFTWIEFEKGGHGVFVLTREELQQYI
ncbi:MAG: 50S ribosomal protein L3 N(5)-glutamine methyltransferase [Pseudomonadota bacterium]